MGILKDLAVNVSDILNIWHFFKLKYTWRVANDFTKSTW